MPKIKIYGYEQLNNLKPDELLTVYNRIAERTNRRISRAAGHPNIGYQQNTKRLPVIKSAKAKSEFLSKASGKKSHRKIVSMVYEAEQLSEMTSTVRELNSAREATIKDIKVLVGQSYINQHHDEAFHSGWVDNLTDEQLQELRKRRRRITKGAMDSDQFIYLIEEVFLNTNYEFEAIRSYEDIIALYDNMEAAMSGKKGKKSKSPKKKKSQPLDERIDEITKMNV